MTRFALTIGISATLTTTALAQPAFYLMGNIGSSIYSKVTGLSRDGSLAVGIHGGGGSVFTWTPSGGRQDVLGQGLFYDGVSRDGKVIAGGQTKNGTILHAIRQSVGGSPEDLGTPAGFSSAAAVAASANGACLVGDAVRSVSDNRRAPFRWTQSGGFQVLTGPDLSDFSQALDVSDDGRTIVGNAQSLFGGEIGGFVWREGVGETLLPHSEFAEGISANGRFIVGTGNLGPGVGAMLWTDGVPKYLTSNLTLGTQATDVSDDGNVVVGRMGVNSSFVWTPQTGLVDLKDYLTNHGVQIPDDIVLIRPTVSGDGLTFGGYAGNAVFASGYVATIPTPSVLACMALASMLPCARRRR